MGYRVGIVAALALGSAWSNSAFGQNATTAGVITTPYPTTLGVAIEWAITGDANNNGEVSVRYRESGASAWKTGLPLLRVPAGKNTTGTFGSGGGMWGNKHAGSLFDLEPAKTYEIELTLTDPDGGGATNTTTAATRPIPVAPASAATKPVTPSTLASALAAAAPGDILLLGAGSYPAFTVPRSGAANQPIVIRGESNDTVTVDGRVTMSNLQWVYLENISVQGEVRMKGASNMVVRGCKIRSTTGGITFLSGDDTPRNNYIVDNDLVGGATWVDAQLGAAGYNGGEGIQFTGSGHVVCWNHVKGFRDNISFMEYDEAFEQVSIDICNNDIEEATDDAIEADSAMGNVRVVRNRIRNCFDGCSSQPNLGGPTYYIRNVMYNVVYSPFKFHNGTVGDVVLHNTVVKCGDGYACYAGKTWSRALFRNNIFIGGTGGGTYGGFGNGSGRVFDLADADATCSFDYDGVGSIGTGRFEGRIGDNRFASLATLQANTTEAHAVAVDMSVFASNPPFPSNPFPAKAVLDLQLAAGSAAIDKGVVLIGLSDGFSGNSPDLGAYEFGAAPPTYGPRQNGAGGGSGGSNTGGSTSGGGAGGSTGSGGGGGVGGIRGSGGSVVVGGGTSGSVGSGSTSGSAAAGGVGGTTDTVGSSSADGSENGLDGGSDSGGNSSGCTCALSRSTSNAFSRCLTLAAVLGFALRRRRR